MAFPRPFGRYVLEERIAMGGMAEIFRARMSTAGFEKRLCIKRILPHYLEQEDFVNMFRDEAALAARLQHTNIVQVFDFGTEEETLYLAMELVDGADLRRLLDVLKKQERKLGFGHAIQIAIEVCRGLHHAHMLAGEDGAPLGIVHRDISPHNILVSRAGEVKVTDFGIAKASARATHTGTGVVKGKLAYMAPEQACSRPADHRLDQFATGIVLWEMITGERLFSGADEVSILRKVMTCDIAPPSQRRPDLPASLEALIMKALAEQPEERFANMRAFEHALTRCLFEITSEPDESNLRVLVETLLLSPENSRRHTAVLVEAPLLSAPGEDAAVPSLTEAGFSEVFEAMGKGHSGRTIAVALGEQSADASAATRGAGAGPAPSSPSPLEGGTGITRTALLADPPSVAAGPSPVPNDRSRRVRNSSVPPEDRTWVPPLKPSLVPTPAESPLAAPSSPSKRRAGVAAAGIAAVSLFAVGGAAFALLGRGPTPSDDFTIKRAEPAAAEPAAAEPAAAEPLAPAPAAAPSFAEEPSQRAPPRAKGRISLEMSAGWAHAFLGKRKLCETPCAVELPAGTHSLRLVGPDGIERRHRVTVKAGETVRVLVPAP
jgi:eukaryotic-like serine/threonine-protein kinase